MLESTQSTAKRVGEELIAAGWLTQEEIDCHALWFAVKQRARKAREGEEK